MATKTKGNKAKVGAAGGKKLPTRSPLAPWLKAHPALRAALAEAKTRFGGINGVIGFGIGRDYSQCAKRYKARTNDQGGLCIRVLVKRKVPKNQVSPSDRLPRELRIPRPKGGGHDKIRLDVIQTSHLALQAEDSEVHTWPTAGAMNVGRVFSFGLNPPPQKSKSGKFGYHEASLGTVGALLRRGTAFLAVSAGHVFVDLCNAQFNLPIDDRAIGADGPQWVRLVNNGSFLPLSVGDPSLVNDAAVVAVPQDLRPQFDISWPPSFDRTTFATRIDTETAMQSSKVEGFVWCERTSEMIGQAAIQIDLLTLLATGTQLPACDGGMLAYGPIWQYRFMGTRRTILGDSGAPVFLRAAGNPSVSRLLGFHIIHDAVNNFGYAVDAQTFLRSTLNQNLNAGYTFA